MVPLSEMSIVPVGGVCLDIQPGAVESRPWLAGEPLIWGGHW
jgi:hypothetical protein